MFRLRALGLASMTAVLLAACGGGDKAAQQGGAPGGGMPAPEVGVVIVEPETVTLSTDLPGRLDAWRVAQVRARAAGIVEKRLFVEGASVKAGQQLYQIDAAPYRATLESATAALARSEANLTQARAQAERYKPLVEANAVSKQDYDNAVAAQKQSEADVAAARAAIQTARINLGYTSVVSPIAGRIGQSLVTEGALVGQGEATPLAVVQQIDPLYVNFTQSSTELLRLRQQFDSGKLKKVDGGSAAEIQVLLDDGTPYDKPGKLIMAGISVDPTSNQITLRAELPNPDGLLLPGMYVRVRIEQAQSVGALLVPQQAVQRSVVGSSVMVVDDQGKVSSVQIKTGQQIGSRWIVTEGLKGGEKVIVDGFQKMMVPGAPVKPVAWQSPISPTAPAAARQPGETGKAAEPGKPGADAARAGQDAAGPAKGGPSANKQ
ncbi:MAG: efflux RND transporter periplasmic adaptor subunit [Burkholderiaceae bacterium]